MDKTKENRGFFTKLQSKWKLESLTQLVLVLVVFACTGTTILLIKGPIFDLLGVSSQEDGFLKTFLYLLLVLPLYQAFLLVYGFIFGQFRFFWDKEKQFVKRMGRIFSGN